MNKQAEIIFIICTYNRAEYLDDTLRSIFRYDQSNLNFELLIVDNNSQDQTADVVRKHQKAQKEHSIKYTQEVKQGLSHARNRGIEEATAPYIVFLDDDIQATESLVPAWADFFAEYPAAAAAGGKIHVQFDDPRPEWMPHFLLPLLGYHDLGNSFKRYPQSKYPFGGNMGFNKSIFEEIGTFNTDLGRKGKSLNAGEEKEVFNRIQELGKDIYYLPDAFLYHRISAERLNKNYIRHQALGLGQSMRLQLQQASPSQKIMNWFSEIGKLMVSMPLAIAYVLSLQPQKGKILLQFRWWIWKGNFINRTNK